jgi:hypothetical protein
MEDDNHYETNMPGVKENPITLVPAKILPKKEIVAEKEP